MLLSELRAALAEAWAAYRAAPGPETHRARIAAFVALASKAWGSLENRWAKQGSRRR